MKFTHIFFLLIPFTFLAQKNVSITKIIEADCSSPFVKSVELYVTGTVDFNSEIQLNYMKNGGLWSDVQIDISALGTITDSFVYIVRDINLMKSEFPSSNFDSTNTVVVNTATNGNDGYQIVLNGNVVSQFGKTNTDADNDTIWEHDDSVASRKPNITDDGTWNEAHWDFSGKYSLSEQTACNGGEGIELFLATLGGSYPLTYGSEISNFMLKANTTSSFSFNPETPLNRNSIKVFYHIPEGDISTMPIVMSFHGSGRDGDNHRDYWINMANNNGFMVFSPEFSDTNYPGLGDNYLMGNIFDDGDNPSISTFNDKNEWTFSTIDPLFEYIKVAISGSQEKYNAWGHSGGAQFLHRFAMYLPNSKLDIAVCSNAGWYTVPETTTSYPYGILNGQLNNTDLTKAFSKKLIVHLGKDDTNQNSGLRRNTIVDNQQGLDRLTRGNYFFNKSKFVAQSMSFPFNWEKDVVNNVGHEPQKMANNALRHILKNTLSRNNSIVNETISIFPNPVKNEFSFDNSKIKSAKIAVFSISGKLVSTYKLTNLSSNQKVDISKLSSGIYFLKIDSLILKIIKQ